MLNRNQMLLRRTGGVLAAAIIAGGVWLSPGAALAQYGPLPAISGQRATTITGTITAIDPATRSVTLEAPGGGTVVVRAAAQVKNLEQLKAQDKVRATYYESIVIAGKHAFAGQPGEAMGATQAVDERGQGQAMAGTQQTLTVVAKVTALDKPAGKITLKGPRGNYRTFKVKDASLLTHFTIGDDVVFKYTEAWAVALTRI